MPPNWLARTHHDVLGSVHGLDPSIMLNVPCACGMPPRRADYMVDVTPLPADVRAALGITSVDYLCDGCTTRLFREGHITQEEFNRLLGAPAPNLALVRGHDREHQAGLAARPEHMRPSHTPVVAGGDHSNAAPIPLVTRVRRHEDTVRERPMHFPRSPALPARAPFPIPGNRP